MFLRIQLVRERVHCFALRVEQLHFLVAGAPHRVGATEIESPGVAQEIGIGLVRINTAVVVEILNQECLTHTRDSDGR